MHRVFENLGERLFKRPFGARDWILRATSPDGLCWTKDESFRYSRKVLTTQSMSYFATRDTSNNIWFHSTVLPLGQERWSSVLEGGGRTLAASDVDSKHLYGPCWCENILYAVAVREDGKRFIVAYVEHSESDFLEVRQDWCGLDAFDDFEDVFVLKVQDVWHGWISVSRGECMCIYHWVSKDGRSWEISRVALEARNQNHWYKLVNNPCVASMAGGGWRMYFRTGEQPAVDNIICSAVSHDLEHWSHEDGVRISPGGVWDTHGVGFPYVYFDDALGYWVMYYAGYWGASLAGKVTKDWWMEYANSLRSKTENYG